MAHVYELVRFANPLALAALGVTVATLSACGHHSSYYPPGDPGAAQGSGPSLHPSVDRAEADRLRRLGVEAFANVKVAQALEYWYQSLESLGFEIDRNDVEPIRCDVRPTGTDAMMAGTSLAWVALAERALALGAVPVESGAAEPQGIHALRAFGSTTCATNIALEQLQEIPVDSIPQRLELVALLDMVASIGAPMAPAVGRVEDSFVATDTARARITTDLLALRNEPGPVSVGAKWAGYNYVAMALENHAIDDSGVVETNRRISLAAHASQQRSEEAQRLDRLAPTWRSSLSGFTSSVTDVDMVLNALNPHEVLLEYSADVGLGRGTAAAPSGIVNIFALSSAHPVTVAYSACPESSIDVEVQKYVATLKQPKSAWEKRAAQLYRCLIAPIAPILDGATRLTIVPQGNLAALPFETLLDPNTGRLVADDFIVSYVPSAAALSTLAHAPSSPGSPSVLALGIRKYSDAHQLEYGEAEALAVLASFGSKGLALLGSENAATWSNLKHLSSKHDYLHLSTHGRYELAFPLASSLTFSDGNRDETIAAHQIMGLNLDARLVVVSACESLTLADSNRSSNADLLGVAHAFLVAGARGAIASLWAVDERATLDFFRSFYGELLRQGTGTDPAVALEAARRSLRSRQEYSHPAYWAPFVLLGR